MSMTPEQMRTLWIATTGLDGSLMSRSIVAFARAIEKKATRAALERAAQVAEKVGWPVGASDGFGTYIPGTSAHAADAIRALIKQEDA